MGVNASVSEHELEALFVANDAFVELERALGVFCPFEAIGMVRQEVRHGQFLRYMLDPQRPHGFGAECLRALMSVAAGAISQASTSTIHPLDVHLMDLTQRLSRNESISASTFSLRFRPRKWLLQSS